MTNDELDSIARVIVDCSYTVHRRLGPGLLESTYQACFAHEMMKRGLRVRCDVSLPIVYDDVRLDAGYRMDMIINDSIVIENKAVLDLHPVYHAQLLTYLKLTDTRLGFLINWNVALIKNGIKRIVNGF